VVIAGDMIAAGGVAVVLLKVKQSAKLLEGSLVIEKDSGDKRRDWWGIDFKGSLW
jgi:hypothetical protein